MLYGLSSVKNFSLKASDGKIGLCDDFLFDDRDWSIRHMVALVDVWGQHKRVLIPHQAFGIPDKDNCIFEVNLTKEQIHQAETLGEPLPGPCQQGSELTGLFLVLPNNKNTDQAIAKHAEVDAKHLRSVFDILRYRIQALDGLLGFVADFLIDRSDDEIRFLVLETGHWLRGKKAMVPPEWITSVNWKDRRIKLNLERDVIEKHASYKPGRF